MSLRDDVQEVFLPGIIPNPSDMEYIFLELIEEMEYLRGRVDELEKLKKARKEQKKK